MARAHHGVMVALWDGGIMVALRDIVMVAASRTARENGYFGYYFRRFRGFIAVFTKIQPVPDAKRPEKAINLNAPKDL